MGGPANPVRWGNRPHPGVRGLGAPRLLRLSRLLRPRYAFATKRCANSRKARIAAEVSPRGFVSWRRRTRVRRRRGLISPRRVPSRASISRVSDVRWARRVVRSVVLAGADVSARSSRCRLSSRHNWVKQAERDEGKRPDGLSTDEREELARLRRENQTLRMEREILKKAALFSPGKPASRRRDLRADRGGEDELPGGGDVPRLGGEPHQLSRLGASRAV